MPEHVPLRYWLAPQLRFEHALQTYPLVVPEHVPLRYWSEPQLMFEHAPHVDAESWYVPGSHAGNGDECMKSETRLVHASPPKDNLRR